MDIFSAGSTLRRSALINMGVCGDELTKPLVVVLYEEGCLSDAENIKIGIIKEGCAAILVPVPAVAAQLAPSSPYLMNVRESVCDLTESLLSVYCADGCAIAAMSEYVAAGMIMGAVRRNVPLCFIPCALTEYRPSTARRLINEVECGRESISCLEGSCFHGRSNELDSFNSFCIFLEGCGISPNNSVGALSRSEQVHFARLCGKTAASRALNLSYPRKELTRESITVGILAFLAVGGCTSALVHILAVAHENGVNYDLFDVEKVGQKASLFASVLPAGSHSVSDFCASGGTYAVISLLNKTPKLVPPCNICGVDSQDFDFKISGDAISAQPLGSAAVSILSGSLFDYGVCRLAREGAVKGEAAVFDSLDLLESAVNNRQLKDDSIIVLIGQSAGFSGLPMLSISADLGGRLLITDGRTDYAKAISLASGEALTVVKSGDAIEIDFKKGKASLNLASKEINTRLKKLKDTGGALSGGMVKYAFLATDAHTGFAVKRKF